jgi:hypothetical protein
MTTNTQKNKNLLQEFFLLLAVGTVQLFNLLYDLYSNAKYKSLIRDCSDTKNLDKLNIVSIKLNFEDTIESPSVGVSLVRITELLISLVKFRTNLVDVLNIKDHYFPIIFNNRFYSIYAERLQITKQLQTQKQYTVQFPEFKRRIREDLIILHSSETLNSKSECVRRNKEFLVELFTAISKYPDNAVQSVNVRLF